MEKKSSAEQQAEVGVPVADAIKQLQDENSPFARVQR
jgi:hypothetical protein